MFIGPMNLCDLFDLQNEGIYRSLPEGFAPGISAKWRDPQNRWCGFAGRVRALALDPQSPAGIKPPTSVRELVDDQWRDKVALADPRLGTTGTHMAILKWSWGEADFTAWLQGLKENGIRIAASNSATRDRVITGEVWIGLTDTDDIEVVRRRGIDLGEGFTEDDGVILLPNVVGLIEGSPGIRRKRKHWLAGCSVPAWKRCWPLLPVARFLWEKEQGGARGTGSEFTG